MNLLTYDCLAQHESPPEMWRILNFDATRAGRAVANAASITVPDHDRVQAFRWGEELLVEKLDQPLGGIVHPTWGGDPPILMPDGAAVDQEPVSNFDDEDTDADIVRWFAEQQAAAEEATRAEAALIPKDIEANEEVMLTRRNGSRSRRSWRGGGTMYRR